MQWLTGLSGEAQVALVGGLLTVLGGALAYAMRSAFQLGKRASEHDSVVSTVAEVREELVGLRDYVRNQDQRTSEWWRTKWPLVERMAHQILNIEHRLSVLEKHRHSVAYESDVRAQSDKIRALERRVIQLERGGVHE